MFNPVSGQSLRAELLCNGKSLGAATAFAVLSDGGGAYLVSNRHVFSGLDTFTGELLCKDGSRPTHTKVWHTAIAHGSESGWGSDWIPVTYGLIGEDFCPTWFEHSTDPQIDLAVLPIPLWDRDPRAPDLLLQPCDLTDPPPLDKVSLSVTTELSVVGYPFGVSASSTPICSKGCVNPDPAEFPVAIFDSATYPFIGANIREGWAAGLPGQIDTGQPIHRADETTRVANRRASCENDARRFAAIGDRPAPTTTVDEWQCDEYPFASSNEGGVGARMKWVPRIENNLQGTLLRALYVKYRVMLDDAFEVSAP